MTKMPLPPGLKPMDTSAQEHLNPAPVIKGADPNGPSLNTFRSQTPAPQPEVVGSPELTSDETSFILKTTLLPRHAEDPNVLKFIANYLICRDVKQAAREAGLTPRDGEILYRRSDIVEAVRQITEKAVMKHGFDAGEVVERVKEIVRVDAGDLYNADGSFKHIKDMAPETRRAIKSFKAKNLFSKDPNGMPIKIGEVIEVEFWDKMKATELLGREKDVFKETKVLKHDLTSNMASVLLESRKMAESHISQLKDVSPIPQLEHKSTVTEQEDED